MICPLVFVFMAWLYSDQHKWWVYFQRMAPFRWKWNKHPLWRWAQSMVNGFL